MEYDDDPNGDMISKNRKIERKHSELEATSYAPPSSASRTQVPSS